jgi:prophage antirepressor-like protein
MTVQVFNFDQNQVRTQLDGEVIWFNANDVATQSGSRTLTKLWATTLMRMT